MTRVRIAPPDIEEDVSAEQVAAYLRSRPDLWIESRTGPPRFYERGEPLRHRDRYRIDSEAFAAGPADRAFADIARAEGRHPSAVLADIVGPARAASVGVACVTGESLDDRVSRTRCAMRAATERHARRLRLERATEDADSAAHGAGESEE